MANNDTSAQRGTDSARIVALEGGYARLHEDVQGLYTKFDKLAGDITDQFRKISSDRKTNWGTMAAWASVIILLMTTLGTLTVMPITEVLNRQQSAIEKVADTVSAHRLEDGHKPVIQRVIAIEKTAETLDITLQREMRLLDERIHATMEAEVRRLDTVLQREMRLLVDTANKDTEALRDRLNRIEARWDSDIHKFLDGTKARLDQVDDRLKNITARLRVVEGKP